MEIWKMFLLFGFVVITMTSEIMMDGISSDPSVSDANRNLKSLAEKYITILKEQVELCVVTVTTCKKPALQLQLQAVKSELDAFETTIEDLHYDCKSLPPSVEHASAVVSMVNSTQKIATYTCDRNYTYGGGKRKVWCDHNYGLWGSTTLQCVECYTNPPTYQGKKSVTQGGIECQRWDSQSPHEHSLTKLTFPEKNASLAERFCRIPNSRSEPWCYTTSTSLEWDYCGIPKCNRQLENDCGSPQLLTNAKMHYSYTSNGARASYGCLTFSGSSQNQYCPVSVCKSNGWTAVSLSCGENDCFQNSREYTGKRSCTVSGNTCQQWSSTFPHDHWYTSSSFPDNSIEDAGNYCRDPDGSGTPWCYTTESAVRHEVCDVPSCVNFPK